MYVIGVTGGIGSGKSTVCNLLAELGALVIDADQISRELTAPNGLAISDVEKEFGSIAITAEGGMDRAYMRNLVFNSSSDAKQRLEGILHPLINSVTFQKETAARDAGVELLVHDVPLLIESFASWRARLDEVWVVDCAESTQVQRTMLRSGLKQDVVEAIMKNQASRAQRIAAADVVIKNDGVTLEELAEAVKKAATRFGL